MSGQEVHACRRYSLCLYKKCIGVGDIVRVSGQEVYACRG